jgi:integrase
MITETKNENAAPTFTVRVFLRSKMNSAIRITRQKKGFRTKLEAEREEQKLLKECQRELMGLESRGVLFCELLDEWYHHAMRVKVEAGKASQASLDDYLGTTKKWFKDYLKRPAVDLTPYAVAEVFEEMQLKGLSLGHQKKIKQFVKAVFDLGIMRGRVPGVTRSPTVEVALKRSEEKKPEILSITEIQRLVTLAEDQDHPWRRIWSVALLTGMRSGELYALTWKDVDFESKLINCNKSYNCKTRSFKSTKAGYWRQVPISPDLESVLLEQKELTGQTDHVFDRSWQWDKGLQAKVLRSFCFINGLPSIKFHTLRACFATQMLRNGVEAARVMKICGWKELKTMQHYVRLAGVEIFGATDKLKIFAEVSEASKLMRLRGAAA